MGDRLRVVEHHLEDHDGWSRLVVVQRDPVTGLTARTTVTSPRDAAAYSFETTVINESDAAVIITALSSLTLGFARAEDELEEVWVSAARSEWLAENRWEEKPVRSVLPRLNLSFHGQDGRGHFGVTSHGAWSSGEHLPAGILRRADGATIAWQVETSGPWHWELSQARDGGVLTVLGPTDLEHQFAVNLQPGEAFTSVPATVSISSNGQDGAVAELTRYRRWLRKQHSALDAMPIVYNDFMNTLMGQPSTEALLPLIEAAADAGVECFCIDAGWYADPAIGDWWATVGEWKESPQRFTNGLSEVIEAIHSRGMRSGIWLEPEVVGIHSHVAQQLPAEAFFHRFGQRVAEHERYQLDLRHPAARAHLDQAVDDLVENYGISYFKLDYNINPGAGTEQDAAGAAAGLFAHTKAVAEWIADIRRRHPQVSVENCSSGAMRADYNLLSVTQLQSTSDQQDFRLYPPVAASAPVTIVPEQCGNWAYPATHMSPEEIQFTLVTGLSGRFYLSGFLNELAPDAQALVHQAIDLHKSWRPWLAQAEPFWPLGLPGWDDEIVCLGLTDGITTRIFVWDRAEEARQVVLPGTAGTGKATVVPLDQTLPQWTVRAAGGDLVVGTVPGLTARVIEVV